MIIPVLWPWLKKQGMASPDQRTEPTQKIRRKKTGAGQDLPDSGVEVESTHETAYVVSPVNVRADAQSGSEVLGVLDGGDSVTVTGICANGWYRVIYDGETGYVWRDYLSL